MVFHPVKGLTSTRCKGSHSKRDSLCRYGWKITVSPRFQHVKTVAIVEAITREAVVQGIGSWEEAARVRRTSHQENMKEMRVLNG